MKVFIIVLVLVGILFAVTVIVGVEDEKTSKSEKENLKKGDSPNWVDWFKGLADSQKPRMKLSQELIKVPGPDIVVPAAKGNEKMRMLNLAWESGGAMEVTFDSESPPPKGLGEVGDPQVVVLANVSKSTEVRENVRKCKEASLMIFEKGGKLKFKMA